VIDGSGHTPLTGAMRAAEELVFRLDAVPDDPAAAVITHWGELVNRALKAVEDVPRASDNHLE
jgi:hypothetical protein